MSTKWWGLLLATVLGPAAPAIITGQVLANNAAGGRSFRCDLLEATNRLRWAHPLGAARAEGRLCLGPAVAWVPTAPMEERQRLAWRRAVGALGGSDDPSCRLAAATLVWLERIGVVSVWTPADTAGGLVYFGSSYLTAEATPLAIQFWHRAFERSAEWLAGALAHEALHVLRTDATEVEATAFGEACGRRLGPPSPSNAETINSPESPNQP